MKLLVAVDDSECALRAVDFVLRKLRRGGETPDIHLLTVHPPIPYPRAVAIIGHERAQEYYEEEGRAALKSAQDRLDREGIAYTARIRVGEPGPTIVDYASEAGVDLIVMGTHGRGAIGRMVLGSVAAKVVQLAAAPVLLVK